MHIKTFIYSTATFYGHFVAGEDENDIKPAVKRLNDFGVKVILDYSAEEDISEEEADKKESISYDNVAQEKDSTLSEVLGQPVVRDNSLKVFTHSKSLGDRRKGVNSARTYFYEGEAQCEKNTEIFLKCIDAISKATNGTGFAAIKLTALGRPQLLLQLSEALIRTRKYVAEVLETDTKRKYNQNILKLHVNPEQFKEKLTQKLPSEASSAIDDLVKHTTYDQNGVINLFSWGGLIDNEILLSEMLRVPCFKTGQMVPLIDSMTTEDNHIFSNTLARLNTIFQHATNTQVRVMVDAEQTYFQPAITRLTLEMMRKYNKEKAIVFNTYQCYLRRTYQELVLDMEQANRQDFYFGAKLVRGAYLDQERERAKQFGYKDPTNPTFEATTEMYHRCLVDVLMRAREYRRQQGPDAAPKTRIMVATHNEETVRFAVRKMQEMNIPPSAGILFFGQLYGMCDQVSFPLGQGGFSVYKYVPYGPVLEVMPYLSRRVEENKGILSKVKKEKRMLRKELMRRFLRGQWIYTPVGPAS
ncbi:unnamed protein product [Notodromas monacha]|uniref:Proline dehydrogenase n=1 Tax=Notodromas monacha TaxID=399045 RepID=A0A7R9BW54_9CRUS|nr:unnamed protein product [Notodromas monacha]CAG0922843.1 unnamed protein product [Notodromas monacha]